MLKVGELVIYKVNNKKTVTKLSSYKIQNIVIFREDYQKASIRKKEI